MNVNQTEPEMFTIPIYGNGSEVTHGVIPMGKGAFVHNGIFSLDIMAGTTAWLAAGGIPRMVYLIDVPVTTMREEVCIVDSQQRYREKTDSTWEIKRSGASRIRVHFEYVAADAEVLTGSGTSLLRYGALNSSVWSPWAEGEIIKVGPVPDSGTEEPDFRIDRIEYEEVMEEEGLEAVDPSEIKEELDILESGVGGECIYKTISSTGQLERLTMSRLERPLVINLRGSAIPVPSSYLDGRVTNHGETPPLGYLSGELYREYYGSYDLIGDRVIEMAPYIDVIKGDIRPKMSADTGPFGVRWRGKIKIEHDEEYTFHLMTGGGVRLRINGIPVIDEWALQPSGTPWTSVSGSIMLAPGFYDIEYEMHQQPGSSVARLEWESRSIERSFVPGTHLYSDYERPPLGYASNGLLGTYFATDNRTATEVTRVDPSVSFDWGAKSPMPSIPDNDFSVIWTGKLRVEEPGEHLFFTSKQAGDGCDLRVNGKEIDLDDDNAINFDAPGYYDIEFRYYEYSLNASVTLSWEQPTRAKEVIPSDHLFHPGGMLQYARGWLDDLGNWIGRNGVVFANTGGHPMKYAIVEGQETVDCWLIGEDGLGELLTPTAEKVQLIRNPNSSGILTITRTGREVNWITRNLKGFRNGTDLYLPSDYDCIPFYRDDDSNETAYGIIPLSRGGYVHCGGVSISALVAMCFMYTSRRSTMDQIEGRYQKGETVWAKVNIHNYFKSLRRYYFEIVVTYPEGGDDAKKIVDREACTLARDGSENIYLSWTPFKEDLAETYSLEIRAYDITTRFHSPLEIWGDELKEEIAVDVEVGAYITGVETSEYFGYFDSVELEVAMVNEMYIDNEFAISGMFKHLDSSYMYWTKEDAGCLIPGDSRSVVPLTWRPSDLNYDNQEFELGEYQGFVYMEDASSAYCMEAEGTDNMEPKLIRKMSSVDRSEVRFDVLSQLEIYLPEELGDWSVSLNGGDGPWDRFDPRETNMVSIYEPDHDIWIRRESREGLGEVSWEGLIGYWPMNEASWADGSWVKDISGNDNHGVVRGDLDTDISLLERAGRFYGTGDRINLGIPAAFTNMAVGDFSIEMWIKTTDTGRSRLFSSSDGDTGYSFEISDSHGGALRTFLNGEDHVDDVSVVDGKWHHVVTVRDTGNKVRMYIDGVISYSGSTSVAGFGSSHRTIIGSDPEGWKDHFDGSMDEVRVYDRALTEEEIRSSSTSMDNSLIGHWDLDEGSGSTAHDRSGDGNDEILLVPPNGTAADGPAWTVGRKGPGMGFDGIDDVVASGTYQEFLDLSGKSLSVSVWFRWDGDVGNRSEYVVYNIMGLYTAAVRNGHFQYTFAPGSDWYGGNSFPVTEGKWHHAVLTYDGSRHILYRDGWPIYSSDLAMNVGPTKMLLIGAGMVNGSWDTWDSSLGSYFNGTVDELRIHDRELPAYDIISYHAEMRAENPDEEEVADRLGLMGYWQMDEESWTGAAGEVADSSGFNNHGKSGDGATTETSPLGRAGSFDGEADRVTIVDDENVRESIELEGALTYEAWVYVRGNASDRCGIMGRGIGYDSSSGYGPDYTNSVLYLLKDGSGQYRLRFEMSNGTDVTGVNDTANFTMMSWHHVAVTWDGTTNPNGLKMYVDGELTNETASSILSIQDASKFSNLFELGTMGGGEWYEYSLDGLLDDARVYNRALSPEEIGRHSQAINESLVGCWRFDEKVMLRSQLAHDSSGHDSHGQLGSHPDGDDNDPAWTTAGWIGNALHFDGVDDQVDCGNDTRLNPSGGSFSVSVWFKGYSRNGTNVLYSKGELIKAAVIDGHFQYYWEPEARWYGGRTFPVQRGRCYHAAVVYHGSNQTVYANGVPVFSRMPGGNHTGLADGNEERFLIGAARNSTGQWNYFNGTIDEVRIYQHALSPDEVAEYYNESIVESALLNRTAFRIRYYADAGNDLYVVYNTTRWDNGLHNHAVLKLPGDGTYLDRNHLNAEFWEAGTILKIAQEPKLVISGRQYYGDARDSSYDGHNTVYLGWGDRVTYDVILNEANFYGMYFTLHGETGSAEFPVHVDLSYYTGDRADTDDYGLRGWLSHNESQDIGFKQGTWDTRALKMRLTPPGRYRITLVARSVPVHIRRLIINPALEFDIPDLYAPVSLGGGEENDTEAEDEGGDNPFNCIGIDMGIRPRGIPDDIWDAMYATVQFPVFQALLDGSGPHISVAFGEYVGVDFKWKVTFDKRTGLFASAMVGIELKIVVPLKQTGIKVIAKVGAEVLYVHNESQKDIHKRFDWKVFLSVEVDIPIFKWIIGVPLCYEVANPHNKDQKLLRLEAECYIVIKAVFRLSSKLGEDRITFALAPFTLGQLVTVKVKVTLDLKSLVKGLEKSKAETEKRNKELEEKSENLEKEKEDLEKKMSDEREQIKKDNPEKSDKEVEKTADKRLENLSKKLDKVNIKIKDSDKEKMKEKSIAAHITDYAAWFTKMALKIPSWLLVKIEITIELKFSIGIFYNFAYQTPNKFLMYYERGFEFVFKISFDLWLLEVGFEFKLVLDWVLWYNKVSIPIGPWEDTYIEVGTIKWSNFKDHLKEGDVNGKLRDAVNTKLKAKYKTPTNQKLCWSPELSQPTQNEALENLDFMPLHPETARDVGEALAEEITEEVAKLLFPYPPEFDSWWKLDDRFIKFDLCPLFFRDLDGKGWGREYLLLVDESEDTITIYAPWDDDGPFGCVPLKLWPPWPPFPDANDLKETISPVPIVCYFSDSSYLYFSAGVSALFWEKSVSFKITFGGEVTVAIT